MDKQSPKTTIAYQCWERYYSHFFCAKNIGGVLRQCRDFFAGKQYDKDTVGGMPKPCFNLCAEAVEKKAAKITETEPYITFISDNDDIDLTQLDDFYEYQRKMMDDRDLVERVARTGYLDGMAVCVTAFDKDTIGTKSLFKGFLKRQIVPFEDTFWENPYCADVQSQRYWGYKFPMEIRAVKNMIEGDKATKKKKAALIVPEQFYDDGERNDDDIDSRIIPVYIRFFRVNGEVCFEASTKFVDIYEHPHFMSPEMNEQVLSAMRKEYEKKLEDPMSEEPKETDVTDYEEMDSGKYTLFEAAVKQTEVERLKERRKFSLYPVSMYVPDPIENTILGKSGVSRIIPNQILINMTFLYVNLIIQYHAMPKWLAKPGALKGQAINNSPSQVLYDYSPISIGTPWGVQRLEGGGAINSNLIGIGSTEIDLTRSLNNTADISAENQDSGYAFEQKVHQVNLPLEFAQKRLWKFITDNARIDMQFFQHYVDDAAFYVKRPDAWVDMQENYRALSQSAIAAGEMQAPMVDGQAMPNLPRTKSVQLNKINNKIFDADFDVVIETEQGIASSQISESQHYEKIWQYMLNGEVPMDKIRVMLAGDPATSRKVRQKVQYAIEACEISQLHVKEQEIEQLKQVCNQLMAKIQENNNTIQYMNQVNSAREKAFRQATKEQQAITQMAINSAGQQKSESEVKSQNAKGVSGGHFDKTV